MLRSEVEDLKRKLDAKDDEINAARRGEAEGQDRMSSIQAAVRAAEAAGAQKLAEESKKYAKLEAELSAKLEDASGKLDATRKRHISLSEKFAQREDVIVELRARMDEYERGVHGLREEVQEKERFKALHEQRSAEVRKMTSERNRREAELSELANEAAWLREQCDVQPGDPKYMDLSKLKLQSQIELEQLRSQVMAQEDELQALERERTVLLKKLRVKALERGERAAKEGISVEKLTAMEELAADLDEDPDFDGVYIGTARVLGVAQQQADHAVLTQQAISASFATVNNVEELRRRGTALQSEVAQKVAALQEAESAKRKAEREKASLLQDRERLENANSHLRTELAAGAGLRSGADRAASTTQLAMLSQQNDAMRAALQDARIAMSETIAVISAAQPPSATARQPPRSTPNKASNVLSTTSSVPAVQSGGTTAEGPSAAAMAALTAAAEQLDDRISSLKNLVVVAQRTQEVQGVQEAQQQAAGLAAASFPTTLDALGPVAQTMAGDAAIFAGGAPTTLAGASGVGALNSRGVREQRLRSLAGRPPPNGDSDGAAGCGQSTSAAISVRGAVEGIERSGVGGEGSVALPEAFSEEGLQTGEAGAVVVDPYDLVAALNAQLIESKALLAGQQSQLVKAEREVRKYRTEMADLHEQQTYLYASYLREARTLQRELVTAEKRAAAAERQHQEDVVRIESWATMADALETTGGINGEEGQRKVAMMGRRLTSLRVREMELARQSTIQHAELKDLRASRASLQAEFRQQQVEAAAELARLERSRRELTSRLELANEAGQGMAPQTDLETERKEKERYLRAYRSLAEQAARTAGCASDAARFESEATSLRQRLALTEAALAAATHAAQERAKTIESLTDQIEQADVELTSPRGGVSGRGKCGGATSVHKLEGRVQALTISEAGALSRAEAAERVLDDAMKGRQELANRLQLVEQPVAELTERLREIETELHNAKSQLAQYGTEAATTATQAQAQAAVGVLAPSRPVISKESVKEDMARMRREAEIAKEEAIRAKEFEAISTMQLKDLSSRQNGYEEECSALREALTQLQWSGDEHVESGKLQWTALQARRSEGEARRREAAANARRNQVQSALFRLQLATEHHDAQLHEAQTATRAAEAEAARLRSSIAQRDGEAAQLSVVMQLRDKVREAAQLAEESHRAATQLRAEREELYTELAAASARDDDQRALLTLIATNAQKGEHCHLLKASSLPSGALERAHQVAGAKAAGSATEEAGADESAQKNPPVDAEIVSLVALSALKTDLKVSELRLRRRVAALELAELSARQNAMEAHSRREEIEEELVRTKERGSLEKQQSEAREADLQSTLSQMRHALSQARAEQAQQQAAAAQQQRAAVGGCAPSVATDALDSAAPASPDPSAIRSSAKPPSSRQGNRTPSATCRLGEQGGARPSPAESLVGSMERERERQRTALSPGGDATGGDIRVAGPACVGTVVANVASSTAARCYGVGAGESDFATVDARAQVHELFGQLSAQVHQQQDAEAENRDLRAQLAAVRQELATSEDALARSESRMELQLAQRLRPGGGGSLRDSHTYGSSPTSPSASLQLASALHGERGESEAESMHMVQQLLAERAEAEQRHAAKIGLAEESIRSVQAQLRRKDAELQQVSALLGEARETSRRDRASAAADSERLAKRLDEQNEDFVQRGRAALAKLSDASEPAARGTELTLREIEEENVAKEELIHQLRMELAATNAELAQSRSHLKERLSEVETATSQLTAEKAKGPSDAMSQRVAQLQAALKAKERELIKLRDTLATSKDDMEVLAAEHTERMTRVSERAARAEAKAEADAQARERMGRLQERLQGLTTEVRAHKQREEAAKRAAAEANEAARSAEALASRTSAELLRVNSVLASLKQRLADVPRREEALRRQLAARTEQLEAMQRGPQLLGASNGSAGGVLTGGRASPPMCRGGGGGGEAGTTPGEQAAAMAEAVAKAVAVERERWVNVSAAVEEVQVSRLGDERQRAAMNAALAKAAKATEDAERGREEALQQAAQLREALHEAEERLLARGGSTAARATPVTGGGLGGRVDEPEHDTADAMRRSRDGGGQSAVVSARRSLSGSGGVHSCGAGTLAVERWAAEKRLQKKIDTLRTKLNEKSHELYVAEGELAKARAALEGATKRESALREGMVHAQEQLARSNRETEGQVSRALAEMRSREQLSNELLCAQRDLSKLRAQLRTAQRAAGIVLASEVTAAASAGNLSVAEEDVEELDAMDEERLRAAILRRDQHMLEQGLALEAHELTISQQQARLRDQAAYHSLLASSSSAPPAATTAGLPRSSGPGGGGSGDGGGDRVGREEIHVVVEKMERVVSNLQVENADLRKRAASTVKYVELKKENRELKASIKSLMAENAGLCEKLESARQEAANAQRFSRELAEIRRSLKAEGEKATGLRQRLLESQEARQAAEVALARAEATLSGEGQGDGGRLSARAAQLSSLNKQLEEQLRGVRGEARSMREELVSKGTLLVDMGAQLTEALGTASAAESRVEQMQAEVDAGRQLAAHIADITGERDALRDALQRLKEEHNRSGHFQGRAGAWPSGAAAEAATAAVTEAMANENATLRAENAVMASELAALSPQFFEEVEDLKYAYATAQQLLARYEQSCGGLPPAASSTPRDDE